MMINFTIMGQGQYRWAWHYAHGDAEKLLDETFNELLDFPNEFIAPDLLDGDVPPHKVGYGSMPCKVEGKDAVLYRWKSSDTREHGLVCLKGDSQSRCYALNKLRKKDCFA